MIKVSVAELKAHLGKYLGMVKEGETVYVTSHRRPVAKLSSSQVGGEAAIEPPTLPLCALKEIMGIMPSSGVVGVDELLAERRRR